MASLQQEGGCKKGDVAVMQHSNGIERFVINCSEANRPQDSTDDIRGIFDSPLPKHETSDHVTR